MKESLGAEKIIPAVAVNQIIREAVKLLMKRIYGQEVLAGSMELPTELIVRESVRNIWKSHNGR